MLKWVHSSGDDHHESTNTPHELMHQMHVAHQNKIAPIQDEFLFREFYPTVARSCSSENASVVIMGDDAEIQAELVERITGVPFNRPGDIVVFSGGDVDAESLSTGPSQTESKWSVLRRANTVLEQLTVVSHPASVPVSAQVFKAAMIILVFSLTEPDISEAYRRAMMKLKHQHGRISLVFAGQPANDHSLAQLVWTIARCISTPELPTTFFLESGADSLYSDIMKLPLQTLSVRLSSLHREARLARAHAVLLSHLKSQLPTFNRQAKQDKLVEDLENIIKTVAVKSGIPAIDFPSAEYLRERIRAQDFTRIKKMKESSLSLISEFIERDSVRISALLPKPAFPLSASSPEVAAFKPCDSADYGADFAALSPDQGLIAGSRVRDHLLAVSKLSSHTLHRIWRLADKDKDGKLSLNEYALCRSLIEFVQAGNDLPRDIA